ncbi:hypothetical protein CsatB_015917 [Cannabis sativa]
MKKFIGTIIMFFVMMMMVQGSYGADRCMVAGEYCHIAEMKICCKGLQCEGPIIGASRKCVPIPGCLPAGSKCNIMSNECCYPYLCNAMGSGYCVPRNQVLNALFPKKNDDETTHHPLSSIIN